MSCEDDMAICNRQCEKLYGEQEAEMEDRIEVTYKPLAFTLYRVGCLMLLMCIEVEENDPRHSLSRGILDRFSVRVPEALPAGVQAAVQH